MRLGVLVAALICVVPAQEHAFTKRTLYVVDVSGSITYDPKDFALSLASFRQLAEQPVDDGEFWLLTFGSKIEYWPGGWTRLPNAKAVDQASYWLSQRTPGGSTDLAAALRFAVGFPRKELTVVVISDGLWRKHTSVMAALKAAQAQRLKNGYNPATVATLGIASVCTETLAAVGQAGGGGCYVEDGK